MYINKRAMLSNVYDICTVVAHLRVSHAQEQLGYITTHGHFKRLLGRVRPDVLTRLLQSDRSFESVAFLVQISTDLQFYLPRHSERLTRLVVFAKVYEVPPCFV